MPNEPELMKGGDRSSKMYIATKAGIPWNFTSLLIKYANYFGCAFAIRSAFPISVTGTPYFPKPSFIKAKTANWGLHKGFIAIDPLLAKIDKHKELLTNPPLDPTYQKQVKSIPLILNLREVFLSLESGEMQVAAIDEHCLVLKPSSSRSPQNCNITFKINLIQKQKSQSKQIIELRQWKSFSWWNKAAWGDFTESIDDAVEVFYSKNNIDFLPLEVLSLQNKSGACFPIIRDIDLLWITHPSQKIMKQFHLDLPETTHQVVNTFTHEGRVNLLARMLDLYHILYPENPEIPPLDDDVIGRQGCTTAFEAWLENQVNHELHAEHPHFPHLFQHGPENHNPGTLSDLNDKIIHILPGGSLFLTYTEKELVTFLLTTEKYLDDYFFEVHPKWHMDIWAPVVKKQIEAEHPVSKTWQDAFSRRDS